LGATPESLIAFWFRFATNWGDEYRRRSFMARHARNGPPVPHALKKASVTVVSEIPLGVMVVFSPPLKCVTSHREDIANGRHSVHRAQTGPAFPATGTRWSLRTAISLCTFSVQAGPRVAANWYRCSTAMISNYVRIVGHAEVGPKLSIWDSPCFRAFSQILWGRMVSCSGLAIRLACGAESSRPIANRPQINQSATAIVKML
jgi:hypothetical protein